jgi:hypothetical protein
MGDHRADPIGTTATSQTAPTPGSDGKRAGKRVARHASEQRTSEPYLGRRVAGRTSPPGRRIARVAPVAVLVVPQPVLDDDLDDIDDIDDVSAHLAQPTAPVTLKPYAGRRIAPRLELVVLDETPAPPPVEVPIQMRVAPPVQPPVEVPISLGVATPVKASRGAGRRVASRRRTRVPSMPLLAGVAVLAISAGGALQAVHPDLAGAAAEGRISPASALSGSSAIGSASLVSGRSASVSRDSDRSSPASLQAAADAQAKERDQLLSSLRGQAQVRSAQIKLHQWVLPVTPGVYHLTARFGDYSALWANFHTGLDFAAPTGTPIMAVASGTITEVGYSGAYGNRTIETLPDGTDLWYCHQNEFGTAVGDKVKAGQVIGYVGSTGNVTGPHLHLEVHPGGGDPVDPYPVLVAHGLYPGPPA